MVEITFEVQFGIFLREFLKRMGGYDLLNNSDKSMDEQAAGIEELDNDLLAGQDLQPDGDLRPGVDALVTIKEALAIISSVTSANKGAIITVLDSILTARLGTESDRSSVLAVRQEEEVVSSSRRLIAQIIDRKNEEVAFELAATLRSVVERCSPVADPSRASTMLAELEGLETVLGLEEVRRTAQDIEEELNERDGE